MGPLFYVIVSSSNSNLLSSLIVIRAKNKRIIKLIYCVSLFKLNTLPMFFFFYKCQLRLSLKNLKKSTSPFLFFICDFICATRLQFILWIRKKKTWLLPNIYIYIICLLSSTVYISLTCTTNNNNKKNLYYYGRD